MSNKKKIQHHAARRTQQSSRVGVEPTITFTVRWDGSFKFFPNKKKHRLYLKYCQVKCASSTDQIWVLSWHCRTTCRLSPLCRANPSFEQYLLLPKGKERIIFFIQKIYTKITDFFNFKRIIRIYQNLTKFSSTYPWCVLFPITKNHRNRLGRYWVIRPYT